MNIVSIPAVIPSCVAALGKLLSLPLVTPGSCGVDRLDDTDLLKNPGEWLLGGRIYLHFPLIVAAFSPAVIDVNLSVRSLGQHQFDLKLKQLNFRGVRDVEGIRADELFRRVQKIGVTINEEDRARYFVLDEDQIRLLSRS